MLNSKRLCTQIQANSYENWIQFFSTTEKIRNYNVINNTISKRRLPELDLVNTASDLKREIFVDKQNNNMITIRLYFKALFVTNIY